MGDSSPAPDQTPDPAAAGPSESAAPNPTPAPRPMWAPTKGWEEVVNGRVWCPAAGTLVATRYLSRHVKGSKNTGSIVPFWGGLPPSGGPQPRYTELQTQGCGAGPSVPLWDSDKGFETGTGHVCRCLSARNRRSRPSRHEHCGRPLQTTSEQSGCTEKIEPWGDMTQLVSTTARCAN